MSGIVYVLTNPAMPGIVKIGKTSRDDPGVRMSELYSTGVPVPFVCEFAIRIENEAAVEVALHTAFGPYRINPRREFFEIDVEQAKAILILLHGQDVTPAVNSENEIIDIVDREAGMKLQKSRRPSLNFEEMGIFAGEILENNRTGELAEILSPKTVKFRNEETSLTNATRMAHDLDPKYPIAPGPHWTYQGTLLSDIYNQTYQYKE